jgi:hypothetical protein
MRYETAAEKCVTQQRTELRRHTGEVEGACAREQVRWSWRDERALLLRRASDVARLQQCSSGQWRRRGRE